MIPQTLYHYTTIETLALILKSRKIRFNSINSLDDLYEPITSDFGNIGNLILVSCWTDIGEESIAQWSLYSKRGIGCRIELPSDLFSNKIGIESDKYFTIDNELSLIWPVNNLFKVSYHADYKQRITTNIPFYFSEIGKKKHIHWSFQSEWRYIIYQLHKDVFDRISNPNIGSLKDVQYKFDFYDMTIRPEVFTKMKILLGPEATSAEEIIVDALISKYNPEAKVINSKLKKLVKIKN